jgi:hypothetical protein
MGISFDVNKAAEKVLGLHSSKDLRRIDGIFFDEEGTPFCSACISPVDNKPGALNKGFVNKSHPEYAGGLFVYKCPGCGAEYNIAGNTLAAARANTNSARP